MKLMWKTDQLFVEKSRSKSYVENTSIADLSALGTAIDSLQPPRSTHRTCATAVLAKYGGKARSCLHLPEARTDESESCTGLWVPRRHPASPAQGRIEK